MKISRLTEKQNQREKQEFREVAMEKSEMIRYADLQDFSVLKAHDKHISAAELKNSIAADCLIILC